jgi:hypothetical protein
MTSEIGFRCCICARPIDSGYVCLDRRIETLSVVVHEGKPTTTVNIASCQTMFIYCDSDCWDVHEPSIEAQLQVKALYPATSFVTPCSRCGRAVNRTQPYTNYNVSELQIIATEPDVIAQCLDDRDFAILCKKCEEPDLPSADSEEVGQTIREELVR